MPRYLSVVLAGLIAAIAAGCSQPSRDDPIRARDDDSFQQWIDRHREVLTPADVKELTEARQMIRYRTMQAHPGMPRDEFREAVYADIDGKTMRDVLMTGYALQMDRARVELENYRPLHAQLEKLRAEPGLSAEGKRDTAAKLKRLDELMHEREQELDSLNQRIEALKRATSQPKP